MRPHHWFHNWLALPRTGQLVEYWLSAWRSDGSGTLQLHVHLSAPRRRAVGVPAGCADALADDIGWAAWESPA